MARPTWAGTLLAIGICAFRCVAAEGPSSAGEKNLSRTRPSSQKWALLIGVDDYAEVADLKYCGRDVRGLQQRLLGAGFADDHVILLEDQARDRRYLPFKSNIDTQLEILLGKLTPDGRRLAQAGLAGEGDLVVVAFSGHGVFLDGISYLCPTDARLERPDSLVSVDRLFKLLEASPAGMRLVLIDACRNDPRPGGVRAVGQEDPTRGFAGALEQPPHGVVVLSSCDKSQVSVEDPDFGHGVFMNFVLQGLAGAADRDEGNRDQQVSLLELYRYAHAKTKAHVARARNLLQTPELYGKIVGDFEFGRVAELDHEIVNSLGMRLMLIPAGRFLMGAAEGHENERPPHEVEITRPFYLGATEVTQQQYAQVMGANPSAFASGGKKHSAVQGFNTANYPVESVGYDEALEFCRRLAERERLPAQSYRLPTEAEWEYAARAGDTGPYDSAVRTGLGLEEVAWFNKNADYSTHEVAKKKPNQFGLFDMAGNVSEWCGDWFQADYYARSPRSDPAGPAQPDATSRRVLRGGHWMTAASACRPTDRDGALPAANQAISGFRVVRVANPSP
ncbi:MAG: SUMF1/EgtB/PvdO family nonheme iron enzyme [Pirellulales bacterium]|nr:SUMF1/EgtB/PvdO family nonheme iron enzyme [Pirellulales bacterium]